jgi:hypothetical protein
MLVVVAAFVANAESQKPRRLTQAVQIRKCRRSPLHQAAALSTSATPNAFGVVSPEDVLEALVQDAF